MSNPVVVDTIFLILALAIPAYCVWRFGKLGVVFGALAFWLILAAVSPILEALDPKRDAAMLDSFWILSGWLAGLIYASIIYAVMRIISKYRKSKSQHQQSSTR